MGAGALFVSNILLKKVLSPFDYGNYSIVITFFSLIFLFGALGAEQILLRFSSYNLNGGLVINKKHLHYILLITLFVSIISTVIFKSYYSETKLNYLLLGLSSFALAILMILSCIFRLNKNFVYSQFVSNFWKVALFLLSVYMFFSGKSAFEYLFQYICYTILVCFAISLFLFFKEVRIVFSEASFDFFIPFSHYFVAIMSFTVMTFADRFIIENKFDISTFGDYFFISSLYLAPFSILQNYIGFRQLVAFKVSFNLKSFKNQNLMALGLGFLLVLFLLIAIYIVDLLDVFHFNTLNQFVLSSLLMLTGVIKIYSASVTSGFEAIVDVDTLKKSNYIIITTTFIILITTYMVAESIEAIVFSMVLVWLIRTWIQKILIINQFKKKATNES